MLLEEKERSKKNLEDYREIVEEVKNGRKEDVKRYQSEMSVLQSQIERLQNEKTLLLSRIEVLSLQMPGMEGEEEAVSGGGRLGSDFEVKKLFIVFSLIVFYRIWYDR